MGRPTKDWSGFGFMFSLLHRCLPSLVVTFVQRPVRTSKVPLLFVDSVCELLVAKKIPVARVFIELFGGSGIDCLFFFCHLNQSF